MAKKDLIAKAEKMGLTVNQKMTVAQIEKAIADASDPNQAARAASRDNPCPVCGRRNPHIHREGV